MNMIDWKLFRLPAVVFPSALVIATLVLSQVAPGEVVTSILFSGILCFFHLVVGFMFLESAFDQTPTGFLKRVLGGMGLRLTVMLLVFAGLIVAGVADEKWLLLGLLVWYSVALVFEIVALQKKVSLRQHSAQGKNDSQPG